MGGFRGVCGDRIYVENPSSYTACTPFKSLFNFKRTASSLYTSGIHVRIRCTSRGKEISSGRGQRETGAELR